MIVFDLKCAHDHVFEAWFDSSAAYADQKARGLVECPICGTKDVEKAVMAPAVPTKGNRQTTDAERKEQLRRLAEYQAEVERNCDYVGKSFVAEARARHQKADDSTNQRGIIGEASIAEAIELVSEGIDVAPLPFRPRQCTDA